MDEQPKIPGILILILLMSIGGLATVYLYKLLM
jgi:hypothetical protein